jgi:repressor of nif and glnA expression
LKIDSIRKKIANLGTLDSQSTVGSRLVSNSLTDSRRGSTSTIISSPGHIESSLDSKSALYPRQKAGTVLTRIESLAYRTDFDCENLAGNIPVNVSLFPEAKFSDAVPAMLPVFERGLCSSNLITLAGSGEFVGDIQIPHGQVGLVTVCSIVVNGCLLKAGVPIDSKFGGILQMNRNTPTRFTEVIYYAGSSLDPSEIFIRAGMTSVNEAVQSGSGNILANFREIPSICLPLAQIVIDRLKYAGLSSVFIVGETSQPICEISVFLNRIGVILLGGLNPVAAAVEQCVEVKNYSMSTLIDYSQLSDYRKILKVRSTRS